MRNVSSSPTFVLLLHVEKDPYMLTCRLTFIQAQLGPRLKLPSPPASRNISYLAQWPHTTHHPPASRILRGKVVCNLHLINAFFPLLSPPLQTVLYNVYPPLEVSPRTENLHPAYIPDPDITLPYLTFPLPFFPVPGSHVLVPPPLFSPLSYPIPTGRSGEKKIHVKTF